MPLLLLVVLLVGLGVAREPPALLLGAQKSGTTALFSYLAAHPGILSPITVAEDAQPVKKEIHFFDWPSHYDRGLDFYWRHFPPTKDSHSADPDAYLLPLDGTPNYLPSVTAPARLRALFPTSAWWGNATDEHTRWRFVAIFRDPLDRARSMFSHARRAVEKALLETGRVREGHWTTVMAGPNTTFDGKLKQSMGVFTACAAALANSSRPADWIARPATAMKIWQLCHPPAELFRFGLYALQLQWWRQHFPAHESYCLLSSDAFQQNPAATVARVLAFLGLPSHAEFDRRLPGLVQHMNKLARRSTHRTTKPPDEWTPVEREAVAVYAALSDDVIRRVMSHGHVGCAPHAPRRGP